MCAFSLIKETKISEEKKVFLKDSDLSTVSVHHKFSVDTYLIFVKKAEKYELIYVNGVDSEVANAFQISQRSMIFSLLKDTDNILTQAEVLNSCKESIFFHKEMGKDLRLEIEYWARLGLDFFYPVRDEKAGLIGFVVFSSAQKHLNKAGLRNFKILLEDKVRSVFNNNQDKIMDKEFDLYKGLYETQRDLLVLQNDEKHERIFKYIGDVSNSSSAIMYVMQDKYYVPVNYNNVSFVKPKLKQEIKGLRCGSVMQLKGDSVFYEELGQGQAIILKPSKKSLCIFKLSDNVDDSAISALNVIINILRKQMDD